MKVIFSLIVILLLNSSAFGADPEPYLKTAPMPFYPPLSRLARLQGRVVLHFVINEEGETSDVEAVGGHQLLREAAIENVRNWKFSWAHPCACRVRREVVFVYSISGEWGDNDGPNAVVKWFGKAPVMRVEIQACGVLAQP